MSLECLSLFCGERVYVDWCLVRVDLEQVNLEQVRTLVLDVLHASYKDGERITTILVTCISSYV